MRNNDYLRLLVLSLVALFISACAASAAPTQTVACDVSPRLPDHPLAAQMRAPVGEFPVWFVTFDSIAMSELGRSLPPYNGGTIRKSLIAVDIRVGQDLTITGHQLDGDALVWFPNIDEESEDAEGRRSIIYSEDDLADEMVVTDAQITTNSTEARGYASHPWAAYYPEPGCYQLSGAYGDYTTNIIVEVRDE